MGAVGAAVALDPESRCLGDSIQEEQLWNIIMATLNKDMGYQSYMVKYWQDTKMALIKLTPRGGIAGQWQTSLKRNYGAFKDQWGRQPEWEERTEWPAAAANEWKAPDQQEGAVPDQVAMKMGAPHVANQLTAPMMN
eukprot:14186834-Heterocapsa_arctica.AAC.1